MNDTPITKVVCGDHLEIDPTTMSTMPTTNQNNYMYNELY